MSDPLKIDDKRLHIDSGSMGGGGPIPFTESKSLRHHGAWNDFNDFFDYQYNYFDYNNRKGIYHYCLYANLYAEYSYTYKDYTLLKQFGGISHLGHRPYFCIFDASTLNKNAKYKNFLHELGHNLLGYQNDATKYGDVYLDSYGHHNIDKCVMEQSGKGSDYCSRCWSELDLSSSLKGSYWTYPYPPGI